MLPKHLLGFRREYFAAQGRLHTSVPDLALEAGSFVRADGGARGRGRDGVRNQLFRAV